MTVKNITFTDPTVGNTTDTAGFVKGGTANGNNEVLLTADMNSRDLLEGILIELRKLNLRQEEAFAERVNDEDI